MPMQPARVKGDSRPAGSMRGRRLQHYCRADGRRCYRIVPELPFPLTRAGAGRSPHPVSRAMHPPHEQQLPTDGLDTCLAQAGSRVHLLGIGGVGMAGLAVLLRARGFAVSGCDAADGPLLPWLRTQGVAVAAGHDPAHAAAADWFIRSTAVSARHPEVDAALRAGRPVFQRGATLARLLARGRSIVVAGAHGKTTTTGLIAQTLRDGGLDPTFCVGGVVPRLGGVAAAGAGAWTVAEGDESDGTLALYRCELGVILNIDFDHMEHFRDADDFRACFGRFAAQSQRVLYCADDPETAGLCGALPGARGFGCGAGAALQARAVVADAEGIAFEAWEDGQRLGTVRVATPGRHNVYNALAALGVARAAGLSFDAIRDALARAARPCRRFERVVDRPDVCVVSDYAHHPTEVRALIAAARAAFPGRLRAVFQPHRYTRTLALGDAFPPAFAGVDELVLTPVYAASEAPLEGGTVWDLYARFRAAGWTAVSVAESLDQAWSYVRASTGPGDTWLVVGAGDVERLAHAAQAAWAAHAPAPPAIGWLAELYALGLADTRLHPDEPLGAKTTWKVGGVADVYAEVRSESDLRRLLGWAQAAGAPVTMVGTGSNMLVSDLGVRGLVLRLTGGAFRAIRPVEGGLAAGAGCSNRMFLATAERRGLSGLEFLEGIPGSIGGALRMNAGAWGGEVGPRVLWVRALRADGGEVLLSREALAFGYRSCPALAGLVVVEAAFALDAVDPATVRERRRAIAERRTWWKEIRSAGSVFRNPPGGAAGAWIDAAGLKGYRIGGARIYERHGNVVATQPGARAADVRALMEHARAVVRRVRGVELEPEVRIVG
jgi:UDP-N-acetylmuramate--alanine ligase